MAAHLAGIEGPNLLEEAVRAGLRIECVFVAQGAESPAGSSLRCLPRPRFCRCPKSCSIPR
jgi:hypothetical protein